MIINLLSEESRDAQLAAQAIDLMTGIAERLVAIRDLDRKVETLNFMREMLHDVSPFKDEPVDLVTWVGSQVVYANDYNPNTVAPPEMQLLAHSIHEDGYTQPIVTWPTEDGREVVDGFHRNRVGKENALVNQRVKGYLPTVAIKSDRQDKGNRIAATIRHNRARGKHGVDAMSDIVVELRRRNWSNEKIGKELGMEPDEVLRLCQITGLAELFADSEFSKAWDVEGAVDESDFEELTDDVELSASRKVHTGGESRIFHQYLEWECYKAGFYNTTVEGMTAEQCQIAYRDFLADEEQFSSALQHVITEWVKSCEHYLTNESMNRIAWLGQAAACYALGIPSTFRAGFNLLTEQEQEAADQVAFRFLSEWLEANGRDAISIEDARTSRQMDIY